MREPVSAVPVLCLSLYGSVGGGERAQPGVPHALMAMVHTAGLVLRVPVYGVASVLGGGAPLRERAAHHLAVLRHLQRRAV